MNWRNGFAEIPALAKIVAAAASVVFFVGLFKEYQPGGFGIPIGLLAATLAATYFLLAGYIYVDAARRAMPPIPWTALAVVIPNCVGFVLYFLLRKPIVHPCPNCARGVAAGAAFCPSCGQPQGAKVA